ncbi:MULTISPECIES: PBSX family phage terminase large subunit [Sphingobacterium]|uniref:PBSX family phage terminase large subunit n=1 Tax=Sphingobacterium TaxID=28453 RepID=UPI00257A64CA|nr:MULTISPECIES: phage terminase large subunit [Sphingobacterium]
MIKIQRPYRPLYENKDKSIILVTGGRGSGKSFNVSTFVERLSFEQNHKMLFSRYTMAAAAISVIPEFLEKIQLDGAVNHFKVTQTEILNKFSGSGIMFRPIKTSSGNQTANLKSIQGLTTFIGDEMEEWESEDDFDKLRLSIRKKGVQNRVILVMNPTNADHFIYKKYIEHTHRIERIDGVDVQISTHPDVLHIHTSYLDNVKNVDQKFLDEIESIKQKSIAQASRDARAELIGKGFEGDEEKFQKEFDKAFQRTKYAYVIIGRWADVRDGVIITDWMEGEFDLSLPYGYGQDYGFSVDPTTLIRVAVDNRLKRIYVDEEYYETQQLSTDAIYQINKSRLIGPDDLIVGDSQEGRLILDLQEAGLNIVECEKGPGSVVAGITAIGNYTIVVTPRSTNIKKELRNYIWNDKKAGIPIDKFNHAIDAIRYIFRRLTDGIDTDDEIFDLF